METSFGILIIFFNKLVQTIECIQSFLPSKENIYVLNNGSGQMAWNELKNTFKDCSQISFFNSEINLGPSGGRNILIDKCKDEWMFIVDNDVKVKQVDNWPELLSMHIKRYPEALAFSPRIFNVHDNAYQTPHQFVLKDRVVFMEESTDVVTNHFTCCGVIINRRLIEQLGNFDERLFAFEDYEFSIRALCANTALQVRQVPELELIHEHKVQKSAPDKKAIAERYNESRIEKSMQHLVEKHSISFDHEWKWWTRKQLVKMQADSLLKRTGKQLLKKIRLGN